MGASVRPALNDSSVGSVHCAIVGAIVSITFRPSLTLEEIQFILASIQASPCDAATMQGVKRKLEVFTLKAKHGITLASHVRAGPTTKAAQLGFEDDTALETLLAAYATNPTSLSVRQLIKVNHHRYLNDMMSLKEEFEYEDQQR